MKSVSRVKKFITNLVSIHISDYSEMKLLRSWIRKEIGCFNPHLRLLRDEMRIGVLNGKSKPSFNPHLRLLRDEIHKRLRVEFIFSFNPHLRLLRDEIKGEPKEKPLKGRFNPHLRLLRDEIRTHPSTLNRVRCFNPHLRLLRDEIYFPE